jgi:hypothetical protein
MKKLTLSKTIAILAIFLLTIAISCNNKTNDVLPQDNASISNSVDVTSHTALIAKLQKTLRFKKWPKLKVY